ncbi:hypothetical protein PV761_03945 [Arthrobacter sp. CC3]|uniref:hypothetical protein n=1 Tax=Arthrobacter sp. CC3 TaxID=3029185 RepID=UPI0032636A0B
MDEVQGPEMPGVQDAPEARKGDRGRIIIICVVAVVLALGGAGFLAANLSTQAEQRAEAEASAASASAAAAADASASAEAKRTADNAASAARARARSVAEEARKAAERADSELKQMEARGWTSAGNQMYFQYLSDSEFTCGRWKCTFLDVVSMAPNGCPGGIYVAVSIDRGEGSIGSTNEITAGLPTGKVARVKLEDTSNQGDGFQITKMNCHM